MKIPPIKATLSFLATIALLAACKSPPQTSAAGAPARPEFARDVRPILERHCAVCHNKNLIPDGWSVENGRAALTHCKKHGPLIKPGDPDHSPLILAITMNRDHHKAMPPLRDQLSAKEIETLRRWIAQGVEWPEGRAGKINPPKAPDDY